MAVVVVMIMLLEWRGISYNGRRLRRLLYDICPLLRTCSFLIVCARDSCSARRAATSFSSYDTGRNGILVGVFLDADETHGDLGGRNRYRIGR